MSLYREVVTSLIIAQQLLSACTNRNSPATPIAAPDQRPTHTQPPPDNTPPPLSKDDVWKDLVAKASKDGFNIEGLETLGTCNAIQKGMPFTNWTIEDWKKFVQTCPHTDTSIPQAIGKDYCGPFDGKAITIINGFCAIEDGNAPCPPPKKLALDVELRCNSKTERWDINPWGDRQPAKRPTQPY